MNQRIHDLLNRIYGEDAGSAAAGRVHELLLRYAERIKRPETQVKPSGECPVSEQDTIMITYGDQFRGSDGAPLSYLYRFLDEETEGAISGVHILPFFPYSSDDGFSVIDYRRVSPQIGSWTDVEQIGREYNLMVDLVLNHCSAESRWFYGFLEGEHPYTEYFITVPQDTDISTIVRPRTHPLLTPFETVEGTKYAWTTFSSDQVDLNFSSPRVLEEMLDVLLLYVQHGAGAVRLDAIAYLWKELGHPSIHHPKTHLVCQLFRAVLEDIAPWVLIITEASVSHEESIAYFGDGHNEAHMVYNTSLPPLVLDAFLREDTEHLRDWASTLEPPSDEATFFNFLASHDGIGLPPARGILSEEEIDHMIETVETRGGRVSYTSTAEGSMPSEIYVNYLSAITDPNVPTEQRARAFLASQAIMLAMAGVPGVYVHSLVGSTNWEEGIERTGENRSINREKLDYAALVDELSREDTLRFAVFDGYRRMLQVRGAERAFHPATSQKILGAGRRVFAVLRGGEADTGGAREYSPERSAGESDGPAAGASPPAASPGTGPAVLCLHNVSSKEAECRFRRDQVGNPQENTFRELISGDVFFPHWETGREGEFSVSLEPYEVMWLKLA